MRTLASALALCGLLLAVGPAPAPAFAADDLASLQERLLVTEQTMRTLDDSWAKLQQQIADPNVFVTGDRFRQIRADQVRELAALAVKLVREHPAVVSELQRAYPTEFQLLTDNGIDVKDLADPFLGSVAEAGLQVLLTQKLPQIERDHATKLQQEHDQAVRFLEDRRAELQAQLTALAGGQPPAGGTVQSGAGQAGIDQAVIDQAGTGQAGTGQAGTGQSTTGAQGGDGTQTATGGAGTATDTGGTGDGTPAGNTRDAPLTTEAVTAGGGTATAAPTPVPGSQPFDTAALENQAWPGRWESECRDGATGKTEKKSGTADISFAGRTATIALKGDGDAMPLAVQLDPQGAFAMHEAQGGGEFTVKGQFQNYEYGDDSYAPTGSGTFAIAIDFSFLADVVGGALSFGATSAAPAEITPEQREANTMRCTGTWELPLPG